MRLLALVADADPLTCNIVVQVVSSIGLRAVAARGARELLTRIEQDQPEIVFSSLDLPDGNGLSLQFDARARAPQARLVLMCRQPTVETVIEALRNGVSDILLKPVDPGTVRAVVDRAMRGAGQTTDSVGTPSAAAEGSVDAITVQLSGGLDQIKRAVVLATVRRYNGNKSAAARVLGIPRRSLYRLLADE
jgi:DNA-binding NtrC family response regulator